MSSHPVIDFLLNDEMAFSAMLGIVMLSTALAIMSTARAAKGWWER